RGPPGVPDVQWAGRVGRNEFDVDRLPCEGVVVTVSGPGVDDRLRERTGRCSVEAHVEEPGSGDLRRRNAGNGGEAGGQLGRDVARVRTDLLRDAHRDVRGPVAVVTVA